MRKLKGITIVHKLTVVQTQETCTYWLLVLQQSLTTSFVTPLQTNLY